MYPIKKWHENDGLPRWIQNTRHFGQDKLIRKDMFERIQRNNIVILFGGDRNSVVQITKIGGLRFRTDIDVFNSPGDFE